MKDIKKIREEIIEKWEASGLLEGLKSDVNENIAKLYECCKTNVMINEEVKKNFLVNRDETGREIVTFLETGKKYYVEYIEPRGWRTSWGDVDPATKTLTGTYGEKYTGAIKAEDSLITKENGFENIVEGQGGSPYDTINKMHEQWKKENGYV